MRMPTPNSMPPFCHHVKWCTHGGDDGLAVAALGAEHAAAEGAQAALLAAGRVVDPLDPLVDGDAREHERRADREDADLARPCRGMCFPKKRIRTNETAGIAGMIQP